LVGLGWADNRPFFYHREARGNFAFVALPKCPTFGEGREGLQIEQKFCIIRI
jgi:hypothetical protein